MTTMTLTMTMETTMPTMVATMATTTKMTTTMKTIETMRTKELTTTPEEILEKVIMKYEIEE